MTTDEAERMHANPSQLARPLHLLNIDVRCRNTTVNAIVEAPNMAIAHRHFWSTAAAARKSSEDPLTAQPSSSGDQPSSAAAERPANPEAGTEGSRGAAEAHAAHQPEEGRPMPDGSVFTVHLAGAPPRAAPRAGRERRPGDPPPLCPLGEPLRGRLWVKHQVAAHDLQARSSPCA